MRHGVLRVAFCVPEWTAFTGVRTNAPHHADCWLDPFLPTHLLQSISRVYSGCCAPPYALQSTPWGLPSFHNMWGGGA